MIPTSSDFWSILGCILDQILIKNRVKNSVSFRGRFFDPSKLIFGQILVSPTLDLKRPYSEFDGFSILSKIASESDLGSILGEFWRNFGVKNRSKIVSKSRSKIESSKNQQKEGSKSVWGHRGIVRESPRSPKETIFGF